MKKDKAAKAAKTAKKKDTTKKRSAAAKTSMPDKTSKTSDTDNLDRKEIGTAIQHLRKISGYKRRKLAKMVGISKDDLVLIEHGGKIRKQIIKEIARALDISPKCILIFGVQLPDGDKAKDVVNIVKELIVKTRQFQMRQKK